MRLRERIQNTSTFQHEGRVRAHGNLFSASGNCGPVAHVARRTKRRGGVFGQAGRRCTCKSFSWIGGSSFQKCLSRISAGMPSRPSDITYSRHIPRARTPSPLVIGGFGARF